MQVYIDGVLTPPISANALDGVVANLQPVGPGVNGYVVTYVSANNDLELLPPGGAGSTGNCNSIVVEFDLATPSPLVLGPLTAGQSIDRALVSVTTAWNGASPSVQVGTASTPDCLLAAGDIDLAQVGQYDSSALYQVAANDSLIVTIDPSTATHGKGTVLVNVIG